MNFPRILLLSRWSPDARYAGGEVLRKIVSCIPPDNIRWAYLSEPITDDSDLLTPTFYKSFAPAKCHWRINSAWLHYFYIHYFQSRRIAYDIAEWVRDFNPDIIWVASALEGISVGFDLRHILQKPVHATIHDAHECSRFFVMPHLLYPFYIINVCRFLNCISTFDTVSKGLTEHVSTRFHLCRQSNIVFPPSIDGKKVSLMQKPKPFNNNSKIRRIGFCGASRVSDAQWKLFIDLLAHLPWKFEIIAFASKDYFNKVIYPSNVSVIFLSYVSNDMDIVRYFREKEIHACYLGVWKDKKKALFAKTSLSSKMTTYIASGLPVIVDAPADSAAWRLISEYNAGILCCDDREKSLRRINLLLNDECAWLRMSEGADQLRKEELDLNMNIKKFSELLCKCAEI